MVSRATEVAANVVGSRGSTSKSNPASKRVREADARSPVAMPAKTRRNAWPRTIRNTDAEDAPRAMRTPISWVRSLTEYAMTPYTPTAARTRATRAKTPTSTAIARGRAIVRPTTSSSVRMVTGASGSIACTTLVTLGASEGGSHLADHSDDRPFDIVPAIGMLDADSEPPADWRAIGELTADDLPADDRDRR